MQPRRPTIGSATRLCLTLPLPPSINEQYYTDTQGHRRLTPLALHYKSDVHKKLRHLIQQGIVQETFLARVKTCYLAFYIEYYFTTPLQRDLDNGLKITLDSLCTSFGANDNRIVDIHLSKRIHPLDPHAYLEIDTLDEWQFAEEYAVQ